MNKSRSSGLCDIILNMIRLKFYLGKFIFQENWASSLFSTYNDVTLCVISKKSLEWKYDNFYGRTDGQADGTGLIKGSNMGPKIIIS